MAFLNAPVQEKKKQECFCFLLVKERSCFRKHRAVKCLLETRVFLPKQF